MTLWIENLKDLVALVEGKIAQERAEVGEFDSRNYDAWKARNAAATEHMLGYFRNDYDASFNRSGDNYVVKMVGIRAASTGGWVAALKNWKRAAERKIATAEAAEVAADVFNLQGSGPAPIEPREV